MAHNLAKTNGKHAMFYHGETPWHGLGTKLKGPATSKEAIKAAGLDWQVGKYDLYAKVKSGSMKKVPDYFATVREDEWSPLGVVGKSYTPLQNSEAFSFFDGVVGAKKAIFETAGALGRGEKIWILAKLPGEIKVLNQDITKKYLLLYNGHDGGTVVGVKFTPVRVVCQNTLVMAQGGQEQTFRVYHYPDVKTNLEKVEDLLGIIKNNYDSIEEIMKKLSLVKLPDNYFSKYLQAVVRDSTNLDSPRAEVKNDRNARIREEIKRLAVSGRGTEIKGVRGTLWGGYNAVTEFVDYRDTRREDKAGENRLDRILFGRGADLKTRAFSVAASMATKGVASIDDYLASISYESKKSN